MTDSPTRSGLTSGPVAPIAGIVIAVGVIAWILADSGPTTRSTDEEPALTPGQTQLQSTPVKAAQPPTPPPAPPVEIPDEDKPVANVRVTPATIQLGYVKPGAIRRSTVQITNDSDEPVRLTGAKRGCSCTEVELTPGVIAPGESVPVTAIFTAGLTPTTKRNKVVALFEKHRGVEIPMHAKVSRSVRTDPADFRMHQTGSYDGPVVRDKGRIRVSSIDGRPIRILSAGGKPAIAWPGSGGDPMLASIQHEVAVDIGDHDLETLEDPDGNVLPPFWVFETDHPEAPVVEVRLLHQRHRPHRRESDRNWVFVENRVVVDAVQPGGSTTFDLPLIWSKGGPGSQQIHEVVSTSPDFTAELVGMNLDGRKSKAQVRITPVAGFRGPFQGVIEFVSDAHRAPLSIIGYVHREAPEGDGAS